MRDCYEDKEALQFVSSQGGVLLAFGRRDERMVRERLRLF